MNRIINLFKKLFDIQEGRCVSERIVRIDDIAERLTVRKEIIFNDKVIVFEQYVDFPQSHYVSNG